jgi:hypothetical protein
MAAADEGGDAAGGEGDAVFLDLDFFGESDVHGVTSLSVQVSPAGGVLLLVTQD